MSLRVVPSGRRAEAACLWRVAERHAGDSATPFCTWGWTETWLRSFGDVVPHEFVVAERDGEPCGAVLLTRNGRRSALRRVYLGTAGEPGGEGVEVEYNGLCTAAADRGPFARALLRRLRSVGGWDELRLNGFDPAHVAPFREAAPDLVTESRPSPVLELDGSADLVDSLASRSTRGAIRRTLRGISPYTTEWADDVGRALEILADLERLHQERWIARGRPGAFASSRFQTFHRDLIAAWVPQGKAVLFQVRHDDEVVAAVYGFVVGDTLQYYQGGFRIFTHNKIRSGYAAHLLLADAARERGLARYEYLAGDHRFKSELSTTERELVWATLERPGPRTVAVRSARAVRGSVRRLRRVASRGSTSTAEVHLPR